VFVQIILNLLIAVLAAHPVNLINILKESVQEFFADNGLRLSAALSYYTIFALAPLLLLVTGIAGLLWSAEAVRATVIEQFSSALGDTAARQIENLLTASSGTKASVLATIIGTLLLILGATGVVGQLKSALNSIWNVKLKKLGWRGVVRERVVSFAMIIGFAFLLLVSLLVNAGLSALAALSEKLPLPPLLLDVLNFVFSFIIISAIFALCFKFLADVKLQWKDAIIGSLITGVLFVIGKAAIGLYLGKSNLASTYGAAASLAIILVWIYYASAIVFFGAEITQVYAKNSGRPLKPKKTAIAA
jgi:membrane protein